MFERSEILNCILTTRPHQKRIHFYMVVVSFSIYTICGSFQTMKASGGEKLKQIPQ